jgi:Na+/H+ antiporter NhaA
MDAVASGDQGAGRFIQRTAWVRNLSAPIREFIATENAGAIVLLAATVVAVVWANSPWRSTYEALWSTDLSFRLGEGELSLDLRHWVNDGLMALFFFVAGLEIRREFDMGELRERRRIATPVLAAIGGLVVPALLYMALNAGEPTTRGWGIPIGTDTAFALGVLSLVGRRCPARIRVFLLTLVIVDDIGALAVVALAYSENVSPTALIIAVGLFGLVLLMSRAGVRHGVPYFLVALGVWLATLASGVHPTIAGIALGLIASAHPPARGDLQSAGTLWRLFREQPTPELARSASRGVVGAISPNQRLEHLFHPWTSMVVVPLFALANAGVEFSGETLGLALQSPVALGIVFGLVVGKTIGITAATWLATRRWLGGFPLTVPWPPLIGAASVAGIGFTVSLLIADITFADDDLEVAKVGVLMASLLAAIVALIVFRVIERLPPSTGGVLVTEPILDLADPVDLELDHIRGSADAPVTLVEYGDFECPFCGQAESVIRDLLSRFGADLRFVFRHLPLADVHENAQLAAEAAEAAHAQGRFWEMHDLLFAHQDELLPDDLVRYAAELSLDVERFSEDLRTRRHIGMVNRDVESADRSGVVGTPTLFINGRRHQGRYDIRTLTAVVQREAGSVLARRGRST